MKTTPFTHFHEELGARMAPFAGYNMPIEYTGIKDEHNTVREKLGVFDVSHMGEFWVKGPKAFELVQKLTSNDVAALSDGKVQYSCFPNETGGIVDDLLVYRFSAEKYLLVVNAANIDKDWAWCTKWAKELGMNVDTDLENENSLLDDDKTSSLIDTILSGSSSSGDYDLPISGDNILISGLGGAILGGGGSGDGGFGYADGGSSVPEPSTWALLVLSVMGLVVYRKRIAR